MTADSNSIQFIVNGKHINATGIEPTHSLLNYLRYELGLTGTKEGCAEGDCGACTVVVAELDNEQLSLRTVNACIQFVPSLHGKAVFTVEYLRQHSGALHPVQQAMVDCHGSQCGFCTPGFIMSLWNIYTQHQDGYQVASDKSIRTALSGNLCRCTGYRPIIEAGHKMFDLPTVEFDKQQVLTQLQNLQSEQMFEFHHQESGFYAPNSLAQLVELKNRKPDATILAGCTDIGLWVNKQHRNLGDIIYIGNVKELKHIKVEDAEISIGAGVPLDDAFAAISQHYPDMSEQWERFASLPIRNAGTLGGNVANGSPIGDSMPWLITLGAQVRLASTQGSRVMPLEDLYVDYMKKSMNPDEIVEAIIVPIEDSLQFRTYKLSKRFDSDISAVCAAFAIRVKNQTVTHIRIAYGGMAAIPKRAQSTESKLLGSNWDDHSARQAMECLSHDYSPMTDMRASDEYRMQTAANLLYRFFLETKPEQPLKPALTSAFAID